MTDKSIVKAGDQYGAQPAEKRNQNSFIEKSADDAAGSRALSVSMTTLRMHPDAQEQNGVSQRLLVSWMPVIIGAKHSDSCHA